MFVTNIPAHQIKKKISTMTQFFNPLSATGQIYILDMKTPLCPKTKRQVFQTDPFHFGLTRLIKQ